MAHIALAIGLLYLALAVPFSLLTPAWENNDEPSHVAYIEHVAADGTPPRIALGNGDEAHQPPLYYYLAAGWQGLLGISSFNVDIAPPVRNSTGIYVFSPPRTPAQDSQATDVHLLRIVSIVCGLVTVLAAVATGWLLTRRKAFAAALGGTVALWPKLLVVDSAVTNSALTVALCALAIPCYLLWRRHRGLAEAAAIGVVLGAAALSAETALPVVGLVLALMVAASWRQRDWRGPAVAIFCVVAVAGWWYVRNDVLYGDPLASAATRDYLGEIFRNKGLLRVPPSLSPSVVWFGMKGLTHSVWYDAGGNQIHLPNALDLAVTGLGVISLIGAALPPRLRGTAVLLICAIGSLVAWLALLRETTQVEGRYLLIAVVAWAAFLVAGAERLIRSSGLVIWPLIFLGVDVYVLAKFLIPYAHP